ncbi:phosphotransferase family protein [Azospirillum thermophilum]|uniref:Phosphotransferase family protein n=1 Tax=Azospirillum thermophilum TaxID=2202148 RepID=A0A2S2CN01_9PROT|nr:phosphotransferase family protein [Azospirillum thermophilum]
MAPSSTRSTAPPAEPPLSADAVQRLEAWVAGAAGASAAALTQDGRLGGGAISLNLGVTLDIDGGPLAGRHACVLRAEGTAPVAASIDKATEFAVLRAAVSAGVAAPEPLLCCTDRAVIGAPFYVMRRAEGTGAGRTVVKSGEPLRDLARELGRQLGRLHRITPDGGMLAELPPPPECPAHEAIAAYRDWMGERARQDPVLAWGLRWLEVNAPLPGAVVLCHRDYRTGNYLVKDGTLTAILDWEFAGWSDPMEDLAWFCSRSWRFGRNDREAGGIADRDDFYAGYEETSGRKVDRQRVAFWETAAYLRWAAIALMQGRRHTSGVEPSLELALTGRMIPEIEMDLLRHLKSLPRTPLPERVG